MADKEPNKNNNYYLVGGQLNVKEKSKRIEMPPKKSKNCIETIVALNSGNFIIAKAEDHVAIKDDNGVIISRKNAKGKILTEKNTNTRNKSPRTSKKQPENYSFDRI